MIESRTINRVYNRTKLILHDSETQQAFLEIVLCCDNQKFSPNSENQIQILTRLVNKLKKQLEDDF